MLKGGNSWHHAVWILIIIGGLNWGLIGLFEYNLVHGILGGVPALERILYVLIGVGAILMISTCKGHCKIGKKK